MQESIDKQDHRILDVKSYIDARRWSVAVQPSFCMIELGLDIPDEVMAHPAIQEMKIAAGDLVAFYNVSHIYEKALGILTWSLSRTSFPTISSKCVEMTSTTF